MVLQKGQNTSFLMMCRALRLILYHEVFPLLKAGQMINDRTF